MKTLDARGHVVDASTRIEGFSAGEYESVAASQTDVTLGAAGAVGDFIAGVLVTPESLDAGEVELTDGEDTHVLFAGGTGSVACLVPFFIPLGIKSGSSGWKISTGADVHVLAIGDFS